MLGDFDQASIQPAEETSDRAFRRRRLIEWAGQDFVSSRLWQRSQLDSLRAFPDPGTVADSSPNISLDLSVVKRQVKSFLEGFEGVHLHYAVKCNPHPALLRTMRAEGASFEIASAAELEALRGIGVAPAELLFSNPVKTPRDIEIAAKAGVWRFAFDSSDELDKLQRWAPGASVLVRVAVPAGGSDVPSEGKFGVDRDHAVALLIDAKRRGLSPYGVTFHVGSQMTHVQAWADAVSYCGEIYRRLDAAGIRLPAINIGGGFPAQYDKRVPALADIGTLVRLSVETEIPYPVDVIAEPGRVLVADAGVLACSVIGVARRLNVDWVHLDVGAFNGFMEALETQNTLRYPMTDSRNSPKQSRFSVTGPTCDSQDTILHEVSLSEDIRTGDRVYIGGAGAYTLSYTSNFNGFEAPSTTVVDGDSD